MWNSEDLDLDAYLGFLGYEGDRAPTLAVLQALQRAHVLRVRWDTIDSFLYKRVRLDLASLQDKLIRRGRGGYCYEHVTLFAAALEALGFRFTAVAGRVQLGAPPLQPRPETHAMLIVEADGARWLTDVGFGSSPLEPVALVDGATSESGPWPYVLRRQEITPGAAGWAVLQLGDGPNAREGWEIRQVFTEHPQYPVDFAVGNHYVASYDRSPFAMRPYVQRLRTDRLDTLDALTWTTERPGAAPAKETVRPHEVPGLLADVFGIRTAPEEADLLVRRLTELPARD